MSSSVIGTFRSHGEKRILSSNGFWIHFEFFIYHSLDINSFIMISKIFVFIPVSPMSHIIPLLFAAPFATIMPFFLVYTMSYCLTYLSSVYGFINYISNLVLYSFHFHFVKSCLLRNLNRPGEIYFFDFHTFSTSCVANTTHVDLWIKPFFIFISLSPKNSLMCGLLLLFHKDLRSTISYYY